MPQALQQWVQEMSRVARARIALANLIFDIEQDRTPKDLLKAFITFVDHHWQSDSGRSADRMIRVFARLDPVHHYCQGQPLPRRPRKTGCSRILDAKTLWEHNIDYAQGGFAIDDEVPESEIARVEREGLKGIAKGEMRSLEEFAWVTKTRILDQLRERVGTEDFAGQVRDRLGLYSYLQQENLIEIRYPAEVVAKMHLAAPTFMEGCPGFVFRSVRKSDGWGRTVNLKTHRAALPEAVHRPVTFTEKFSVRRVGRPGHTEIRFNWDKFADRYHLNCSDERVKQLQLFLQDSSTDSDS